MLNYLSTIGNLKHELNPLSPMTLTSTWLFVWKNELDSSKICVSSVQLLQQSSIDDALLRIHPRHAKIYLDVFFFFQFGLFAGVFNTHDRHVAYLHWEWALILAILQEKNVNENINFATNSFHERKDCMQNWFRTHFLHGASQYLQTKIGLKVGNGHFNA